MATRISLYEANDATARFHRVDLVAKRTEAGDDFFAINPLGQVPVLRTDGGDLLTENPAVLQYVADRYPAIGMSASDGHARYELARWLSFIGSELHEGVFMPLIDPKATEGARAFARERAPLRFQRLERHLTGREYLLDRFTVADAYLVTVLNWTLVTGFDLAHWPALKAYYGRLHERPSVAKAFAEERALYMEEKARRAAT
jgi:glutathione S-transferase